MNCDKCHEPIDLTGVFYVTDKILCESCHMELPEPHDIIEELELCVV